MAYNPFDDNKPATTDNGTTFVDETRYNLHAMRDAVVMGVMPNWNLSVNVGAGSNEEPDELIYAKGTERLKIALTWGNAGGADGNVETSVYSYSSNNGSSYDVIATLDITYNTDGTVLNTLWS